MFTMLTTMTSSLTSIISHRLAQRLPPVSFFGMGVGTLALGQEAPNSLSAVAYLPAVAQNFVAAMACAAFGWTGLATLFLGAGFFSWLALESMIMHRTTVSTALPVEERPTLGIQMAPAVVGGVAYTSIHSHAADLFAMMLLGYGLYQFLILLRLMPWIRHQRFVPSYWSFSFGIAALSNLSLRLYERTHSALMSVLSIALLAIATGVITLLIGATLRWAWRNAADKGDHLTNDITQTTNP